MARSVSESKVETTSCDDVTTTKEEEDKDNNTTGSIGGGCLKCGLDNDHANLLLCEVCNDEYHTYCLDPPLMSVPDSDFYCGTYVRMIYYESVVHIQIKNIFKKINLTMTRLKNIVL